MFSVKLVQLLWRFYNHLSEDLCQDLFGKTIGTHLWHKYRRMDFDFLNWWAHLDNENRAILVQGINKWVKEHGNE